MGDLSFTLLGFGFLALAGVGVLLPLLPTVPFVLVAGACFARGSAGMNRWLRSHPKLGPMITQWQDRGAVPRGAKTRASLTLLILPPLTLWLSGLGWASWLVLGGLIAVALAYLWTRPD